MTGKGTMQTANVFVNGEYEFVVLPKPENAYHLVIEPHGKAGRPVIVFWDISTERLSGFAAVLREFFNKYKPQSVMFSGSTETTWPGVERLGAQLLLLTFDIDLVLASNHGNTNYHNVRLRICSGAFGSNHSSG